MTSETFALTPQSYLNRLAGDWLSRNWLLLSLPFLATLLWAMFDERAFYVALIMIFLLYPMGLTIVLVNYGPSEQSVKTIWPKQMTLSDDKLSIFYLPKIDNEDDSDVRILPCENYSWQDITGYETTSRFIILKTGRRLDDRIIIPFEAMSDEFKKTLFRKLENLFPQVNL